jgi:uncharacterized protein YerC
VINFETIYGHTGSTTTTITRIDKTAPQATLVMYNPATATNGNVEVRITLDETGRMEGNGRTSPTPPSQEGLSTTWTKVFTDNTGLTVSFFDLVGNAGSTGILIDWIDRSGIIPTITYIPSTPTSGDVVASITFNKSGVVVGSTGGANYMFTADGSHTFTYHDPAGNTGSATATVNRIDKTAPTATVTYNPTTTTSGSVVMTLTASEPIYVPVGRSLTGSDSGSSPE